MIGAVFATGAQWARADFLLHTRADREFQYTDDDNFYNSNHVDTLEKVGIRPGVITDHNKPKIPRIVWEELVANALVHRDYFVSASVRVLVFSDRVEIISTAHLPSKLTVENIKARNYYA